MNQTLFEELQRVRTLSGAKVKQPQAINEMMSTLPQEVSEKEQDKDIDVQVLRAAIISELDAVNLYEQMANKSTNEKLKKLLLDIAKEEKTHFGEFQAMLLELDKEQSTELETGKKEQEDITD
jgi:rubrerythrin